MAFELPLVDATASPKVSTKVLLQDAITDYFGSLVTTLSYKGNWDASAGTFPTTTGVGSFYIVSLAGTVDSVSFAAGDWLISISATPSTTIYASNWSKAEYSISPTVKFDTFADLDASTATYPEDTLIQVIEGGYTYKAAASGADDQHLTTAGGSQKLYVLWNSSGEVNFRAFRADPTGIDDCSAALTSARSLGCPIVIDGTYKLTATSTASGLQLVGKGGTIAGFNGSGIIVTGGKIDISGDITFSGFEDSADPDNQATNYTSSVISIAAASSISTIHVSPGVKVNDCRSFIRALSVSNDFTPDITTYIGEIDINGLVVDGSVTPINIRTNYGPATVRNSKFYNIIGAGREVCAAQFYIDGLGTSDLDLYSAVGPIWFTNNLVDGVIQRTTTGDSTSGNNYECCGLKGSGVNVQMHGNTLKNITGVDFDCEALYTKAVRYSITNNIFENAGTEEGAINAKGVGPETFASTESMPGYDGLIAGNRITFDSYSYDHTAIHGSGATEALTRSGIHVTGPDRVLVRDNTIIGSNGNDIRVNGNDEPNSQCWVIDNKSADHFGPTSIYLRGAFKDLRVEGNGYRSSADNDNSVVRMINYENTTNRGENRNNNRISGNTFVFDDSTFTGEIALLNIQTDAYGFNVLETKGNIYDVNVNASATQSPLMLDDGSVPAGTGMGDRFEMSGWVFARKVTSDSFQPIRWGGTATANIRSYDIDLKLQYETTDNTTFTALQTQVLNSNSGNIELDYIAARTDSIGNVISQKIRNVMYDNSGTAVIGTTDTISSVTIGTTAGVSATVSASSSFARIRVNGNASETWRWYLHFKASALSGAAI